MKNLGKFLKYLISLLVAVLILWLVFRGIDFRELLNRIKAVNFYWIYFSLILAFGSHYLRAYRWNMLLEPIGYKIQTYRSFLALMTGYLANLAIPRMGEVTRCAILKKTDGVAIPASFGSVISERLLDLLVLLLVMILSLVLEFKRLSTFFHTLIFKDPELTVNDYLVFFLIVLLIGSVLFFALSINMKRIKNSNFYKRIRPIIGEAINGLLSIKKIKNKPLFILVTIIIWICYYLMSYVMVFSLSATSGLGPIAGLVILMAGAFGMTAPVQGGIGTYHAFVSSALLLYGINRTDGVLYATLLHSSHLLFMLVIGSLSLIIAVFIGKSNKKDGHS